MDRPTRFDRTSKCALGEEPGSQRRRPRTLPPASAGDGSEFIFDLRTHQLCIWFRQYKVLITTACH
jgi:hypothetical protein